MNFSLQPLALQKRLFVNSLRLILIGGGFWATPAGAQIVPDNTLPANSVVTPNGNLVEITGGSTAGTNLFHSFERFSVSPGTTAFFNNAGSIQNIIGRVTGGSVSNIDGLIRANGTANLFLLNPNGILFGPNATLQIGGSFIGSTADNLQFADGFEFSAANPQATPLLSVNIPVGLQYGATPGDITVQGTGNNLSFNLALEIGAGTIVRDNRPPGLQVAPNQTLALIGGNISLLGGNLTAENGQIVLGSVNSGNVGLVSIDSGWSFDFAELQNFQNISFSDAASVDTSGNGGGRVQIQGRQVTIRDGSAILAETLGTDEGGDIVVKGSDLAILGTTSGTTISDTFPSLLSANVNPEATGQGGDIRIETVSFSILAGGRLVNDTYGSGNAGNTFIQADEVTISGGASSGASSISNSPQIRALGNGGEVQIAAKNFSISNGAVIFTGTSGFGNGGNLVVKADDVELTGTSPNGFSSGVFSNVTGGASGQGGDIIIEADRLRVANGAQATALTFGAGSAGNLTVQANEVELSGTGATELSGLQATVGSGGIGAGGSLTINAGQLSIREGAQVSVGTAGTGQGGSLRVRATRVDLSGGSELGRSGLFSNAIESTGDGGSISINANQLNIQDGATINASNFSSLVGDIRPGSGRAGSIEIQANTLVLGTTDISNPSSITAATLDGGGGNITLNVRESIIASRNSQISAETRGAGVGGSITVRTDNLNVKLGSALNTSTQSSGNAGLIEITANEFDLNTGGQILSESQPMATGIVAMSTFRVRACVSPVVEPSALAPSPRDKLVT